MSRDLGQDIVRQLFVDTFLVRPKVLAFAPGRIEVLGNHTDYNEGYVLSCATDMGIYVALGPSPNREEFVFVSTREPKPQRVAELCRQTPSTWINYPLGVAAGFGERGQPCPGFCLAVHGDLPAGAGVSSSAALEMGTAVALRAWLNSTLSDEELAVIGRDAEHRFVGTQCGLLDQLTSLLGQEGRLLLTDFRSLQTIPVPLPRSDLRLVLTLSGRSHRLAESAYNDRRAECMAAARFFSSRSAAVRTLRDVDLEALAAAKDRLAEIPWRRALHVVNENQRVQRAVAYLADKNLAAFGEQLFLSHQSSSHDFANSCAELDALVAIAAACEGVIGSRLTGGGFGGATLTVVPEASVKAFINAVSTGYRTPQDTQPEVLIARAASGAQLIAPAF